VWLACLTVVSGAASPYCLSQLVRDGIIEPMDMCDFSGMNLAGKDLSFAVIEGAIFDRANLAGAIFEEAEFNYCSFVGAVMDGLNAMYAVIEHTSMANVSCVRCDFTEVEFEGDVGLEVIFRHGVWTNSIFFKASIMHADLSFGNFQYSDFTEVGFEFVMMEGSDFSFGSLWKAMVLDALPGSYANFNDADCSEVEFTGSDLTCATFHRTMLDMASFVDMNILVGASFTGALGMYELPPAFRESPCPTGALPPPPPTSMAAPPPPPPNTACDTFCPTFNQPCGFLYGRFSCGELSGIYGCDCTGCCA